MNFLDELATSLLGPNPQRGRYHFLVTPRPKATIVFVHTGDGGKPAGIIRVDRGDGSSRLIYQVLHELGRRSTRSPETTVLPVLGCLERGLVSAVAMPYLEGEPMNPSRARPGESMTTVADWISGLVAATEDLRHLPIPTIFQVSDLLAERQLQETFCLERYPLQLAHGDLSPGNLLLRQGSLVAIDWDSVCLQYPLSDWFFFLTGYYQERNFPGHPHGTNPFPIWRRIFWERSAEAEVVLKGTCALASRLALDQAALPDLLRLFMVSNLQGIYFKARERRELLTLAGQIAIQSNIFDRVRARRAPVAKV